MEPWHRSLSRASIAPLVWWSNQKRPCRNSTFQRAVRRMVVSVCVFFFGGVGWLYNILQYPDIGTSELQPPDINWRFQHHSTINHQPPPLGHHGHPWPPLDPTRCPQPRRRNIMMLALSSSPWDCHGRRLSRLRDSLGQLPGHLPGPSDRNPGENRHLPVVCSTPHPSWAIKIMTQWHMTDYTSYKVDLASWSVDLWATLSTQSTPKFSQSQPLDHTKSEVLDHTTNTYQWVNERSCCAHLHLSPIFCYNPFRKLCWSKPRSLPLS